MSTDESTDEEIRTASGQGWVDKDNYTGDNWKSAKQFIEDGNRHSSNLKDRNDRLLAQVKDLQSTMSHLVEDQSQQKEKAVKKALSALNREKIEAINDSDGERAVKIDEEIDRIKSDAKPASNPVFDLWVKDNPWYENNQELRMEADFFANLYAGSNTAPEQVYTAVARRIKREFPDHFENPNKKEPASMSSASHKRPPEGNGKSYGDLPKEAQVACDRFVQSIPNFTQEKYLATYEWE